MILLALSLLTVAVNALAEELVYPVRVSENGRYLVDQKGNPVFWLGTTQWELFRGYSLEDAKTILEKTASHGFTFVQVKLLGQGDGTAPDIYGQKPWTDDPLKPNDAYFKHVDAVVRAARDNNLIISMTIYHQSYRKYLTPEKARSWARWLGRRYKDAPNIVWSSTPEAKQEYVPILRELAAGLREGDGGRHLITFKPDPVPAPSSSFIHNEKWLDFNSMQVWNAVQQIYPMVIKDYNLKPTKPTLMAEAAYEAGSEYGFEVGELWVRRQAYYSYLAGGHHTYGHNDSWRILPTWKQALDAPGARQMGILRKIFEARPEWWLLMPDQSIFATDGETTGRILNLAARHKDGKWAMVYLADKASFSINMNKLAATGKVNARWIDPRTGDSVPAGSFTNTGARSFSTPAGWEDALLILESSAD